MRFELLGEEHLEVNEVLAGALGNLVVAADRHLLEPTRFTGQVLRFAVEQARKAQRLARRRPEPAA